MQSSRRNAGRKDHTVLAEDDIAVRDLSGFAIGIDRGGNEDAEIVAFLQRRYVVRILQRCESRVHG